MKKRVFSEIVDPAPKRAKIPVPKRAGTGIFSYFFVFDIYISAVLFREEVKEFLHRRLDLGLLCGYVGRNL